jgi:hypothetical protein
MKLVSLNIWHKKRGMNRRSLNSLLKNLLIMRRLQVFLIILTVAVCSLLILAAISVFLAASSPSYYQSSWIGQMWQSMGLGRTTGSGNNGGMGGMMGGNGAGTASTNLWVIPVALIAAVALGIIGFSFYMVYPEIRNTGRTCEPTKNEQVSVNSNKTSGVAVPVLNSPPNSCEVILKTITPEEQKVLTVLMAHEGKYLQKYVGKEAGLSRLKTHRIVARFAERGIVTVKPLENTNEVTISDWVNGSKTQGSN